MSTRYYARMILGVRLKDVYEEERVTQEVDKFDPDTGAKVKKKVTIFKAKLFGKTLSEEELKKQHGSDFFLPPRPHGLFNHLVNQNLEVYTASYLSDLDTNDLYREAILGRAIGKEAALHGAPLEFTNQELTEEIAAVQQLFQELGCSLMVKSYLGFRICY